MHKELTTPVQYIKSVGPKRAEAFAKIGINTVRDLLFYFPTRHLDRTTVLNSVNIARHVVNGYEGEFTIIGKVVDKEVIRYGRKQFLKVQMKDKSGFFDCVWFQGIKYFKNSFNVDEYYAISARPTLTRYGHLQFAHPDFDKITNNESDEFLNTGKIIPFYKVSKELRSSNLGDLSLRRILNQVVENYADLIDETLPHELIEQHNLLPLKEAIKNIHFPANTELLEQSKTRFKYEELFYFECLVALRKYKTKHRLKGISFKVNNSPIKSFIDSLPFKLTKAQLKVLSEIRKDMENDEPMNRLLQGDVGSGKTIVALISMLIAVSNGYQAALMAPTEILADQHFKKIYTFLENTDFNVALLLGGQKKSIRQTILNGIKKKDIDIVIGTHALIEGEVEFADLGLVVIDEQHRFGVVQRSKLIEKSHAPDTLIMTATPIPRTLSMTLYGDLDLSVIDSMPKNRKPIKTTIRGESKLPGVFKFITDEVKEGRQAFVVYPLVEESEKLDLKDVTSEYEKIRETYLSDVNVGLIHGKMKWQEKEAAMEDFLHKKFDVLFSTTVIEVGIDIPNASVIVINDAFRFGLSQLHQLRGRVGRGNEQSYCILITKDEHAAKPNLFNVDFDYLSPQEIEKYKSIIRMNSMVKYTDGFKLSEIDFKLRGPGNIFGTQQSGYPDLKFADIVTDKDILIQARQDAFNVVSEDNKLTKEENSIIKHQLLNNYKENLKYSSIA